MMVLLVASDGGRYVVERDVIELSVLIKNMIEDVGERDDAIPLPNVTSAVLNKVLEFCDHYRNDSARTADPDETPDEAGRRTTELGEWEQTFLDVTQEMLFDIILAANYLDIKPLLDVGCKTVADMIKGKSAQEIRELFNIVNDFTPEEEAQLKKENVSAHLREFCAAFDYTVLQEWADER